jgi:hypothetical protein
LPPAASRPPTAASRAGLRGHVGGSAECLESGCRGCRRVP